MIFTQSDIKCLYSIGKSEPKAQKKLKSHRREKRSRGAFGRAIVSLVSSLCRICRLTRDTSWITTVILTVKISRRPHYAEQSPGDPQITSSVPELDLPRPRGSLLGAEGDLRGPEDHRHLRGQQSQPTDPGGRFGIWNIESCNYHFLFLSRPEGMWGRSSGLFQFFTAMYFKIFSMMTENKILSSMVFPLQVNIKEVMQHVILWYTYTGKCSNININKGGNS